MIEGYKDIEFIKIPKSWNAHFLGCENPLILKEIRNGLTVSQSKEDGKYKVSRIETISNETIDETRVRFVDEIDKSKLDKYLIKRGEILFSHINSDPHLGKTAIAERDYDDLLHGMNLLLFKANEEVIEPVFLNSIFRLYRQIGVFLKIRSRAVNQSSINQNKLKNLQIPLPPLPEQRKIAYILSTVQKAIEQQDKLIRHTTELKKALMQKLFTEGTKGEKQKETEIGLVPESWEEIKIGDLGKCVTGTTPKTAVEEYWNSNDFDFIAPADIGNTKYVYNSAKKMSQEGLGVSRVLPKNSVLCVCIGSSIGKVGLTFKDQSASNQQVNSIICKSDYNPTFTYYLMVHYAEHWRGHATFGPVPILNKGQFELIKIFVTKDKKEQSLIAECLQSCDSKIEFHGKKKQSLNDLFKTLLHELMTGERRVREIEFEALTKAYKIKEQPLSMAAED